MRENDAKQKKRTSAAFVAPVPAEGTTFQSLGGCGWDIYGLRCDAAGIFDVAEEQSRGGAECYTVSEAIHSVSCDYIPHDTSCANPRERHISRQSLHLYCQLDLNKNTHISRGCARLALDLGIVLVGFTLDVLVSIWI